MGIQKLIMNSGSQESQIMHESSLCKICQIFYSNPQLNSLCSACFKSKPQNEDFTNSKKMNFKEYLIREKPEGLSVERKELDHSICNACNKKIGIRGYKCHCEYSYCKNHLMPEDHKCDFDFK